MFKRKGAAQGPPPAELPLDTLTERLDAFKRTVMGNPRIKGALQRWRFSMVTVLEGGAPGPSPRGGRTLRTAAGAENALSSAVAVEWDDVVRA